MLPPVRALVGVVWQAPIVNVTETVQAPPPAMCSAQTAAVQKLTYLKSLQIQNLITEAQYIERERQHPEAQRPCGLAPT